MKPVPRPEIFIPEGSKHRNFSWTINGIAELVAALGKHVDLEHAFGSAGNRRLDLEPGESIQWNCSA
jgi:hypothetical protein